MYGMDQFENELKEFNRKNKQMKNYLLEDLQKYKD